MSRLQELVGMLEGQFDNEAQYRSMQEAGEDFPFAEHVNTVCNDRIMGLPEGFAGVFLAEESYYTQKEKKHASPHLFLFTQEGEDILLTSYELPPGCDKTAFTGKTMPQVEYGRLKVSEKFTPARYTRNGEVWEGGSVSMFSPVLKFSLWERFSGDVLEVSETMEMNGKRTLGYDEPILYRRKNRRRMFL